MTYLLSSLYVRTRSSRSKGVALFILISSKVGVVLHFVALYSAVGTVCTDASRLRGQSLIAMTTDICNILAVSYLNNAIWTKLR